MMALTAASLEWRPWLFSRLFSVVVHCILVCGCEFTHDILEGGGLLSNLVSYMYVPRLLSQDVHNIVVVIPEAEGGRFLDNRVI